MIVADAIAFVATMSGSIRPGRAFQIIIDQAGFFADASDRRLFEDSAFAQWHARADALKAWCAVGRNACR